MSIYEILATIFTAAGFVLSIVAFIKSNMSQKISQGQIEISIHQLISQTEKDLQDISLHIGDKEILHKAFDLAVERNMNAYEEACAKYLDSKVDKERFKNTYYVKIYQLVNNTELKNQFISPNTSYPSIVKVFEEWNNS